VRFYFNKYIDGIPHVCEALELSQSGLVARRIGEPESLVGVVALELDDGAERVWVCAERVHREGELEVLRFVATSSADRARLSRLSA
jgi:hypothetical protein